MFLTVFRSNRGTEIIAARDVGLAELERIVRKAPTVATKDEAPLLKLARFGELRTNKQSLRHDINVTAVSGVECDYDGELLTVEEAATILRTEGIASILYTSASHAPERPRWRILAPLSHELAGTADELRQQRRHWVGVMNALFGGIFSPESFTLSQTYYFGPINGRPLPEILRFEGRALDQLDRIPAPFFPEREPRVRADGDDVGAEWFRGIESGEHIYQTTLRFTAHLIAKGIEREAVRKLVWAFLQQHRDTWASDAEQRMRFDDTCRKLKSMIEGAVGKFAPSPEALPRGPQSEWLSQVGLHENAVFLVNRLLPDSALAVLYGPSNSGKSTLALDLGFAIAHELTWRGLGTRRGLVVYLAGEGRVGVARRLLALRRRFPDLLPGPLMIDWSIPNLRDPEVVRRLIDRIQQWSGDCGQRCVLVTVDTLTRHLYGSDSDPMQMAELIAAVDLIRAELGCALLLVHHTGKDPTKGARGHSMLLAAADTEIEISNSGPHWATITKQRDVMTLPPMAFDLAAVVLGKDRLGEEITACVIEHRDLAPPKRQPKGEQQARVMLELERRAKNGEAAWTGRDVMRVARELGVGRSVAYGMARALTDAGFLLPSVGGYVLPELSR